MIGTAASPPAESAISPSPLVIGRTLGTVVVTLHGQVDGSISSLLAAVLRDLIEGQGNQSVVVDLSDLHRLHDSVVDVLLRAAHTSSGQGSHLALSRPSADVVKALEVAGLADLVVGESEQPRRDPPRPLEQARNTAAQGGFIIPSEPPIRSRSWDTEKPMTKLQQLRTVQTPNPWLDNLTREYLRDGTLARMVGDGWRQPADHPGEAVAVALAMQVWFRGGAIVVALHGAVDATALAAPLARRPRPFILDLGG